MTNINWADGYCIRPMTESDLPAVHILETSAHSHPWTYGILTDNLKSGYRCWVLEKKPAYRWIHRGHDYRW